MIPKTPKILRISDKKISKTRFDDYNSGMMNKRYSTILVLCGSLIFSSAIFYPAASKGAVVAIPPALSQISQVRKIQILDEWMGLSDVGPTTKYYELTPAGEQFSGKATFLAGGGAVPIQNKDIPISIPTSAIKDFLKILSGSTVVDGQYKPLIQHTDDYPSRKIVVTLGTGAVLFASQSQGEFANPWSLTIQEKSGIVPSKNPGEALIQLKPFLKNSEFESFLAEIRKKKTSH